MIIRSLWLSFLGTTILCAQNKPDDVKPADILAALQNDAQQKSGVWEALAADLENRVSHLLPCDQRVQNAIEEVSRASETRLAALTQYLQAKESKARLDSQALSGIIARQEALALEMKTEQAESAQERAATEAELGDIGESAKQSAGLGAAQKKLETIELSARQRSNRAEEQSRKSAALIDLLRGFGKSFQDRQTALDNEMHAASVMTTLWHEYYAARLARAQAECTVINGGKPARQGKKQ